MQQYEFAFVQRNYAQIDGQTNWELRGWGIYHTSANTSRWAGVVVQYGNISISLAALNMQPHTVFIKQESKTITMFLDKIHGYWLIL